MIEKIYYIDRRTGEKKEEKVYFESTLRFLYGSLFGKFVGKLVANLPLFSKFFGWWQRRGRTKKNIAPFISKYEVNHLEFDQTPDQYLSFDAFFIRKLKEGARPLASGVVIPADGRYLFYQNISSCDGFVVKGKKFSLARLLDSPLLAQAYDHGSMAIARLCPSD